MLFKKSNTSSKSLESFRLLCFKPNSNRSCINGIIEDFLTSSWGIFSNVGSFLLLWCHVIPRREATTNSFKDLGLSWPGIEPTTFRSRSRRSIPLGHSGGSDIHAINPQTSPCFLRICSTSLLKTLWEKDIAPNEHFLFFPFF